jgi:hypothetical protein
MPSSSAIYLEQDLPDPAPALTSNNAADRCAGLTETAP